MAIAIASGAHAGARALHRHRRRLPGLGAAAAAASRSAARPARSSCWSLRGRPPRDRRTGAGNDDRRRHAWWPRLPACRHLHQVHSLSGDGRISPPASRSSSSPARCRICSASTLAARSPPSSCRSSRRLRGRRDDPPRAVRPSPQRRSASFVGVRRCAAALAGHADRGRHCAALTGFLTSTSRPSARASAAFPVACRLPPCPFSILQKCARWSSRCLRYRAARRHQVAAVGGRR